MTHLRRLVLAALIVAWAWGQTPTVKTFFEQLPKMTPTPSYEQLLHATDQIAGLSKAEAQDLLPVVLADIKDDQTVGMYASLALYSISRGPDSGELLKPRLNEIAALFARSDPRFKATADHVLMNMKPQAPEAVGILTSFISGPTGTPQEKVDALTALAGLPQRPAAAQFDAVALPMLKLPLDPHTLIAAINGTSYKGASDNLVDAVAEHLKHTDAQVKIAAIQAIQRFGPAAVAKHSNDLAKLAGDASQPPPVRRLAQNALDGKDERCVTLQGQPIPGCK